MLESLGDSLVSAAALLLVAYITFVFNKKLQIEAAWREEKLLYYKEFVNSMSDIIQGEETPEGHRRFARATNNLHLIASREVLLALHSYREQISTANCAARDLNQDDLLLASLVRAIRVDLRLPDSKTIDTAVVRLWASGTGSYDQKTNEEQK